MPRAQALATRVSFTQLDDTNEVRLFIASCSLELFAICLVVGSDSIVHGALQMLCPAPIGSLRKAQM